jgi:hypothetical protein
MIQHVFGWPLYIGQMKNHEEIKSSMQPVLDDPSYFHKPKEWRCDVDSTWSHEKNEEIDYSLFRDEVVNVHLREYLSVFEPKADHNVYFSSWINRYKHKQYQEQHSHTSHTSHLSCTYFMTVPENSGTFTCVDPSFDYLMSFGLYRWYNNPQYTRNQIPTQTEGTIIIFPSNIEHFVTENKSKEDRVTISGNFALYDELEN